MAYTKTVWKNGQEPALNETNLNHIEDGIYDATELADGKAAANSFTITLLSTGWSNNAQTVTATGVTASNDVVVSPVPAQQDAYSEAAIICTAQAADALTFTCGSAPSANIVVNVMVVD